MPKRDWPEIFFFGTMYGLITLLGFSLICVLAYAETPKEKGRVTVCGKDVDFIQEELNDLASRQPLPYNVRVERIRSDVTGWCVAGLSKNSRIIYLMPNEKEEQLKVLRHEWFLLWRTSRGLPADTKEADAEARKAENP